MIAVNTWTWMVSLHLSPWTYSLQHVEGRSIMSIKINVQTVKEGFFPSIRSIRPLLPSLDVAHPSSWSFLIGRSLQIQKGHHLLNTTRIIEMKTQYHSGKNPTNFILKPFPKKKPQKPCQSLWSTSNYSHIISRQLNQTLRFLSVFLPPGNC